MAEALVKIFLPFSLLSLVSELQRRCTAAELPKFTMSLLKKKCLGAKMDQMCPNWPKNEVFVSFLKFKPSDSADFAYSSSFLLSLTTIATKLAEKNF